MAGRLTLIASGILFLVLGAGQARALVIEDFESDGAGTRYSVVGGGGSGDDFFGLQSIGNPFGFTGFGGSDFFAGRDLNSPFAGGANPLSVELLPAGGFGVPAAPGPELSLLLAASTGGVWDAGQDYVRIILIDADTLLETTLDTFTANGASDLESATYPGLVLGTAFQPVDYALPGGLANFGVRIEAYNTGNGEFFGFDSVAVVAEPPAALLAGLGLALVAARRSQLRKR